MSSNAAYAVRGIIACCAVAMSFVAGPADAADSVAMTVVHQFDDSRANDAGGQPGTVAFGSDGSLYGTTLNGGTYGAGTIFKIGADGRFSTIYTFRGPDGSLPSPCLLPGADGKLYGTVGNESYSSKIRVFSITPTGEFTELAVFFPQLGAQNQRSVIVRATDGQRYAVASYGTTSFVLVQQTAAARGSPAFQLLHGIVPTGAGLDRPNYVAPEPSGTPDSEDRGRAAIPQPRVALCGDIAPSADGHFWKASLFPNNNVAGAPERSVSTDLRDGFRPAIPLVDSAALQSAGRVSGRLAEADNGTMLATVGEHEIIGFAPSLGIAQRIPLAPLGERVYSVMGLLRARDGYFYGLALVDGQDDGSIMIYRTTADGPPEAFYRFPHSGTRETIKSPLVEGPDGSLYVTTMDSSRGRRGTIYRVSLVH